MKNDFFPFNSLVVKPFKRKLKCEKLKTLMPNHFYQIVQVSSIPVENIKFQNLTKTLLFAEVHYQNKTKYLFFH